MTFYVPLHNPGLSNADLHPADRPIDVEEMARVRLQHSPYRAIRRVACEFTEGTLVLRGVVPTFHYKQLAQTAVSAVPGVARIVNSIEVDSASG